jgi:Restriction Endonuclease associating with ARP
MKSSQALVQSVFGNLCAMKLCSALQAVTTEEGSYPFQEVSPDGSSLALERRVATLGEPRPTSIDISIQGPLKVAVECKLAEYDVGHCSRPNLDEDDPGHCDGSYRCQHGRRERCALTELGVRYWEFVPRLFKWRADQQRDVCPLRSTYQLVRNILAVSIGENGEIVPGFAVLVFDERNPAFRPDGPGGQAFAMVKAALLDSKRLQRLSWQTIMQALLKLPRLQWMTSELEEKYGL